MRPVWVAGSPRTGTSTMSRILNHHPNVRLLTETLIGLRLHRMIEEGILGMHPIIGGLENPECDLTVDEAALRMFHEIGSWFGSPMWFGDKDPQYTLQHDVIDERFPGSRWIVCHMNHDDTVRSILAQGWRDWQGEPYTKRTASRLWNMMEDAATDIPNAIHVELSHLVEDPQLVISGVYGHLGLHCPEIVESAAKMVVR